MFFQNSTRIPVISQSGNCQYLSKILFHEIFFFQHQNFIKKQVSKYISNTFLQAVTPLFFCQMSCFLAANLLVLFKSSAEIVYSIHPGNSYTPQR